MSIVSDTSASTRPDDGPSALPGVAVAALAAMAAVAVSTVLPVASPLVLAVALGAVAANATTVPRSLRPGFRLAATTGLRVGVVLLGLRLSLGDVATLGLRAIAGVIVVVALTFCGTRWLARRLGVPDDLGLLVATGFAVCGASAIAAMDGVAEADEEEVTCAIALVTLCGTLAIVVLPLLAAPLGLGDPGAFGAWVGASVHDVAQVVATASSAGPAALTTAVTVKLTRVVLLAPLVALMSLRRPNPGRDGDVPVGRDGDVPVGRDVVGAPAATHTHTRPRRRLPAVPWFVVGFLVAVALRSLGVVQGPALDAARHVEGAVLATAMVGLGTGVQLGALRRLGVRPVVLALLSWLLVASGAWLVVRATGLGAL